MENNARVATPTTISGNTSGSMMAPMDSRMPLKRAPREVPKAARVAMAVAARLAQTAISRLLPAAWRSAWLAKAARYQSRLKPVHTVADWLALKENTTSTTMGAYRYR
ncbi:hypothetical protein FQZ97_1065070 [compost metagenome]